MGNELNVDGINLSSYGDRSPAAIKRRIEAHGKLPSARVMEYPSYHFHLWRDARELLSLLSSKQQDVGITVNLEVLVNGEPLRK